MIVLLNEGSCKSRKHSISICVSCLRERELLKDTQLLEEALSQKVSALEGEGGSANTDRLVEGLRTRDWVYAQGVGPR